MAEIGKTFREAWIKGMETIGSTANGIADSARYKVEKLNLQNRSREILSSFGEKAYALWKQGAAFPEELMKELQELDKIEKELDAMEQERQAQAKASRMEPVNEEPEAVPSLEGEETEAPKEAEEPKEPKEAEKPQPLVDAPIIEVDVEKAEKKEPAADEEETQA